MSNTIGCLQCGEPEKALEVIEEMMEMGVKPNKFTLAKAFNACANLACLEKGQKNDRSVVSWTTMIIGCAQNGQARESLDIFDEMILKGIEPNYITYISVLHACSQGGFIEEVGRAGRIKEADDLFLKMPFQPGVMIWQTLLAACHLHGDVETGKRAAEHAIDLNSKDSASYVLLSNMFAGLNNWDGVGRLRQLMKTRDVRKRPGSSWL
ncbi:hypothetical protein Dsin_005251 [Dipteronia sinensis]|uniref:Pentatricopeptide repeat-containing protein n=1 Tax=Dipteronia sinensis TaxID=43782 RepID=A0AAE0AXF3_9ROSI|nr:hypothetical protein Dsin_005251 [Dipteronia sinensis]